MRHRGFEGCGCWQVFIKIVWSRKQSLLSNKSVCKCLLRSQQSDLQNSAHMQCHKRLKSSPISSHYNSLLTKSTASQWNFLAWRQSHMLILIIGDGKALLNEILNSSIQKVISRIVTAVYSTRAVTKRRFDLWWLIAFIPAFSWLWSISSAVTACLYTRAVSKRRFDLKWLIASILAFSRLKLISWFATARHNTRAVLKAVST